MNIGSTYPYMRLCWAHVGNLQPAKVYPENHTKVSIPAVIFEVHEQIRHKLNRCMPIIKYNQTKNKLSYLKIAISIDSNLCQVRDFQLGE